MRYKFLLLYILSLFLTSCFTSQYFTREPAIVKGVDMDASIKVARDEFMKDEKEVGQALSIWILRDQYMNAAQAKIISDLYLSRIDSLTVPFNIWHLSWAISNIYRLGDDSVKAVMFQANEVAKKQPDRLKGLKKVANYDINEDRIVSGFIHVGGRYYATLHLVVPGNKKYIQSYEAYVAFEEKQRKKKK